VHHHHKIEAVKMLNRSFAVNCYNAKCCCGARRPVRKGPAQMLSRHVSPAKLDGLKPLSYQGATASWPSRCHDGSEAHRSLRNTDNAFSIEAMIDSRLASRDNGCGYDVASLQIPDAARFSKDCYSRWSSHGSSEPCACGRAD